jgi:hypothetical protein
LSCNRTRPRIGADRCCMRIEKTDKDHHHLLRFPSSACMNKHPLCLIGFLFIIYASNFLWKQRRE